MRAPASSAGHVLRRPRLGVERRRRQAPRRGVPERQRPRVQVGGHVRPVSVGQRAEHPHAHAPQVRHPLLVAPLVPDRPADPDQRPGRIEVLPHPAQHPRRQEVRVDIRQPRQPEPCQNAGTPPSSSGARAPPVTSLTRTTVPRQGSLGHARDHWATPGITGPRQGSLGHARDHWARAPARYARRRTRAGSRPPPPRPAAPRPA